MVQIKSKIQFKRVRKNDCMCPHLIEDCQHLFKQYICLKKKCGHKRFFWVKFCTMRHHPAIMLAVLHQVRTHAVIFSNPFKLYFALNLNYLLWSLLHDSLIIWFYCIKSWFNAICWCFPFMIHKSVSFWLFFSCVFHEKDIWKATRVIDLIYRLLRCQY